ncbi:hypothetical protein TNCV_3531601 [Trichonephila clavipes]|nr:hypothetical protein TNCV_3531601 [Trichonephila clavipes]
MRSSTERELSSRTPNSSCDQNKINLTCCSHLQRSCSVDYARCRVVFDTIAERRAHYSLQLHTLSACRPVLR